MTPGARRGMKGSMSFRRFTLVALVAALVLGGCSFFKRLDVESVSTSVQKPSNVAVYLKVNDGREPVTDLTEQNFNIYENEQLISPEETKQILLAREVAALHKVLLLVDMSTAGKATENKQISRAVANFVSLTRKTQAVTVYAFDGREKIQLIGDFPKGESGPTELPELDSFKTTDTSRNLNGAVLEAIKELGARLMSDHKPIRVGTLVVLTTGPDRAGRITQEQLQGAVDATNEQVIALGIGDEKAFEIDTIGKDGTDWAPSLGGVGPLLDDASSKVQSMMERYYLLSYCSPARAGMRRLKVEVVHTTLEGEERKGNFELDFDATGFGPGCDPKATPGFGASGVVETVPGAEDDGGAPKKPVSEPPPGKKPEVTPKPEGEGDKDEIVPPPNKPGFAPVPK